MLEGLITENDMETEVPSGVSCNVGDYIARIWIRGFWAMGLLYNSHTRVVRGQHCQLFKLLRQKKVGAGVGISWNLVRDRSKTSSGQKALYIYIYIHICTLS